MRLHDKIKHIILKIIAKLTLILHTAGFHLLFTANQIRFTLIYKEINVGLEDIFISHLITILY